MSEIDDLPDYEEDIITHDKLKKTIYKKPKKLPHPISDDRQDGAQTRRHSQVWCAQLVINYLLLMYN